MRGEGRQAWCQACARRGRPRGQADCAPPRPRLYSSSKLRPLALWLLISWIALSSSRHVLSAGPGSTAACARVGQCVLNIGVKHGHVQWLRFLLHNASKCRRWELAKAAARAQLPPAAATTSADGRASHTRFVGIQLQRVFERLYLELQTRQGSERGSLLWGGLCLPGGARRGGRSHNSRSPF